VERGSDPAVATFFAADEPFAAGATAALGADVARHARVLRLGTGSTVRLVDGAGNRASGTVVRLATEALTVMIDTVETLPSAPDVHLMLPVADRDRMLWLAEKCAELELTSWRPVLWRRSRSVKPRGEGPMFAARVRARMTSALEQSASARLPAMYPEATLERAIAAVSSSAPEKGTRVFLDRSGGPISEHEFRSPVTLAVGPEGGLEEEEKDALTAAGFVARSLGSSILRFETAAIAALAIARVALAPSSHHHAD